MGRETTPEIYAVSVELYYQLQWQAAQILTSTIIGGYFIWFQLQSLGYPRRALAVGLELA